MYEMPAWKQAKVKDKKVLNIHCATVQITSSPVRMYEYIEINMVRVFAGL